MEGTNDATVPGAAVAEAVAVGLDIRSHNLLKKIIVNKHIF